MLRYPHPLLRAIGLTIRALRREQSLSQEALADLADIDRSYMSSVERGVRNISVLNLARIAGALSVPLRDLLGPREQARPGIRTAVDEPQPMTRGIDADWEPGRYLSLS